jgi:hypothetical protein
MTQLGGDNEMGRAVLVAGAIVALAIPAVAAADKPTQTDRKNAAQECRFERGTTPATRMAFRAKYGRNANGRNAFGKCVSSLAREEAEEREDARTNAAQECKAEQAMSDEDFKAVPEHENKTFEEFYGTNENLQNAFGKCVSTKAKAKKEEMDEQDQEDAEDRKEAAKACLAERTDDIDAFRQTYGTNRNKRNAFGKCVSEKVREAKQQED